MIRLFQRSQPIQNRVSFCKSFSERSRYYPYWEVIKLSEQSAHFTGYPYEYLCDRFKR
jgi:hypothetical protein